MQALRQLSLALGALSAFLTCRSVPCAEAAPTVLEAGVPQFTWRRASQGAAFCETGLPGITLHGFVETGMRNHGRWNHTGGTFVRLAMVSRSYTLDGFLRDPRRSSERRRTVLVAVVTLCLLGGITAAVLVLVAFNRRLRKGIADRTRELGIRNEILIKEINDRIVAERSLESNRNLYRALVDNLPQFVFLKDTESRYVSVNRTYAQSLGLTPEDMVGTDDYRYFPTDLADKYRADDRRIMASAAGAQTLQDKYIFDGREQWIQTVKTPVRDANGTVTGILGIFWDITEQKTSQDALLNREEHYRALAEASPDMIYVVDRNARILYANPTAAAFLARPAAEVTGMRLADVFPHPVAQRQGASIGRVFETGEPLLTEVSIPRRDGSEMWVDARLVPLRDAAGRVASVMGISRDLTDRRRTEEAMRSEELRHKTLLTLNQMHDPTISTVMDYALDAGVAVTKSRLGYIYFYSEEKRQFTLYSWSRDVMHECTVVEPQTIYELDKTGLWGEAVRQRKAIITNSYEAPNPHKRGIPKGHVPLTRHMNIPVFDEGQIVAVIGVANKPADYDDGDVRHLTELMDGVWKLKKRLELDAQIKRLNEDLEAKVEERTQELRRTLAELRRRELSLREKTEELDRFFTLTLDLLCIADTGGYFRRLNKSWESTLGFRVEELEGTRLLDLVHPDDLAATQASMQSLSEQKEALDFVNRCRCRDGSYRWIEWRSTPAGDRVYAAARDITQRRMSEAAIKDVSERFALATTSAQVGIWDWDVQRNVLVWNDQMHRLYGIDSGAFSGAYEAWQRGLHPDDRERAMREVDLALTGERPFDTEFRVLWPDGTVRYLKAFANVHRNEHGKAVRMIGTNWDITHEREAQQELVRAIEEADRANRAKSEFLANMSHEIRTPLNAVIGFSELLSSMSANERQQQYAASIKAAGRSLLRLITDVLDLSKLEAGMMKAQCAPVDLATLFEEIGRIFEVKIREKNLTFAVQVDPLLPDCLMLDEVRLRQVLLNIVGNAVKFTDAGHVHLRASLESASADRDTVDIAIAVSDTGIGIPKQEQRAIFEPFRQQAGQSHAKYGGTGLGLSISSKLTEMMDGVIDVDSRPGGGSTFTIRLRRVARAAAVHCAPPTEKFVPAPVRNLSGLAPQARREVLSLVQNSRGAVKMREMRVLAQRFRDLGDAWRSLDMHNLGDDLDLAAVHFDIARVNALLAEVRALAQIPDQSPEAPHAPV